MVRFRGHEEEREYHALDLTLLARIWPFIRPYRMAFGACLVSLLVSFGLEAVRPYLLRLAVDSATGQGPEAGSATAVWTLGSWFLASTLLSVGIGYFYTWTTTLNGQRVIRDVRATLYRHLLALSPRYFDRNPAGKLVTRVTSDVENLNELISTGVLQTGFDLLKVFGLATVMLLVEWRLGLFVLGSLPILVGTSLFFRKHARDSFRSVRGHQARLNGFAAEAVGGVTATRVFGQEALVQEHFDELNQATNRAWLHTIFHFALFFALVDMVIHLMQAGLLWVGGTAILGRTLSYGEFIQFWMYAAMITDPLKELGEKYNVLQSAFASAERIFHILDERPSPVEAEAPRPGGRGRGEVRCEGIGFRYRQGVPVLDDVSFATPSGTTTAIVGPTGAGKSTLLSMLSRLQDPDRGRVLLDGVDLRELRVEDLRRRVAVVLQNVLLFSGSILENVRLFDPDISREQVEAALEAVGATEFVAARHGGLDAAVEERGATFSLGERQLLSFARALVADPEVLILDEATASIDSDSEARIQQALATLLRGRTCIVVAHRLSTVRHADQILVMQDGRIVERGRHDDLVAHRGVYQRMLAGCA